MYLSKEKSMSDRFYVAQKLHDEPSCWACFTGS